MIAPAYMNNSRLDEIISNEATQIFESQLGFWKFEFCGRLTFVVTDETHNRMRIMTPVIESNELAGDDLIQLLNANFDRALDARYCINGDHLWSAFIHPLEELTDGLFLSGLNQVVTLADNYGTSFSSGALVFGGE